MTAEALYERLLESISENELKERIDKKIQSVGGLLSEEGALLLIAGELGINIEEPPKEKKHFFISDINEGMQHVDISGRIMRIFDINTFQRKTGSEGRVQNIVIADKTGSIRIVFWDDQIDKLKQFKRGDVVTVRNGYLRKGLNNEFEISLGKDGIITSGQDSPDYPPINIVKLKIRDIEDKMSNIDLTGRVSAIYGIREFSKKDGSIGKVGSFVIMDETGEIRVTLWDKKAELLNKLVKNDLITIENAYSKMGLNSVEINLGATSNILFEKIEREDIPKSESSNVPLSDIKENMRGINIEGYVKELYDIRTFTRENGTGKVGRFLLSDDKNEIKVVLWDDKADYIATLVPGTKVRIESCNIRFNNGLEAHLGLGSRLESLKSQEKIDEKKIAEYNLSDNVNILARVNGIEGDFLVIIDESGNIPVSLNHITNKNYNIGDSIKVIGTLEKDSDVLFIKATSIQKGEYNLPTLESIINPPSKTIDELLKNDYCIITPLIKHVVKEEDSYIVICDDGYGNIRGKVKKEVQSWKEYDIKARIFENNNLKEFYGYDIKEINPASKAKDIFMVI
ncbi:MAG: Replication factor A [Candidatus Methanofastidiosum methylothiophilum]|uniref:Replication factor A n=1 Tax=Candidatus Methanofastidiosum methylothiophilum TaxID=1705564 RepID=A0A150IQH8_9EURY|nr:MAG: Replication factor A [Candidatus Methanofastidiosum methylthiophilus]KYC47266.1 MAG: Replication factor A [Candidatus Methanofastidiosum methylthiophilus]KYC50360.1 MAG: Replication factor A [Candidatus Methanofastidiosum methylthiophilus]